MLPRIAMLIVALGTLTACGYSQQERAASGALIGAGVGAVGSAITGGSTLGGALLGGAAGAATGAATNADQIDLGKPIWKRDRRYDERDDRYRW